LLRNQLAGGQDASVLYREMGRALRATLYLAVAPELGPVMSDAHLALLQPIADAHGADPLSRMLGVWLEQESLVREAGNRELALEVAALRLARWPAVRAVEDWLAGPGGVIPTGGRGSAPPEAPPDPGTESRGSGPRARGAAEASTVSPQPKADKKKLIEEAHGDPGVVLATRILGGDVVSVRPDGGSTD